MGQKSTYRPDGRMRSWLARKGGHGMRCGSCGGRYIIKFGSGRWRCNDCGSSHAMRIEEEGKRCSA